MALLRTEPDIDRTQIATTSLPTAPKAEYVARQIQARGPSRLPTFPHTLDQSVGLGSRPRGV